MDIGRFMLFDEAVFAFPFHPARTPPSDSEPVRTALFALLAAAIRDRPPSPALVRLSLKWEDLHARAARAQVLPLLYPVAARMAGSGAPPRSLLEAWRKQAFQAAMIEERRLREAQEAIATLAARNIPCVAFKGMAVRFLYPQPSLRTMGDVDLLVPPETREAVDEALWDSGFRRISSNPYHACWSSGPGSRIEVHTALMDDPQPDLERRFFEQGVMQAGNGNFFRIPAPGDAALFQVLHMAKHARYMGFGVRELADLTLQLERDADAGELTQRLDACGAGTFGRAVMRICQRHLGLCLPDSLTADWSLDEGMIDRLVEDVASAGVHGESDPDRALALSASKMGPVSPWRILGRLAFPPATELGLRYRYSRHRVWLIAVAWAHRLVRAAVTAPMRTFVSLRFMGRLLFHRDHRRELLAELGLIDR